MSKQIKSVLIVEDSENNIDDACSVLKDTGLTVYVAKTLSAFSDTFDALLRREPQEFIVLTDLYFPVGFIHYLERDVKGEICPLGLMVMAKCREHDIGCRIVTSEHRHGDKINQICFAHRILEWPELIDTTTEEKNWTRALRELVPEPLSSR